ncbi:MAG: hypothetical protein H7233_04135 [Pseudorhodobacter sp.]|nr:hypothetical protein [Frankiaceae bacterium]
MSSLARLATRSALLLAVTASAGSLGSAALAGSSDALSPTRTTAARMTAGFDTPSEATRTGMSKRASHAAGRVLPPGTFAVTVPSHSVAAPDGLPVEPPRGLRVRIAVLVWSAAGEEPGSAVLSVDGSVAYCPTVRLRDGAVVRVTCDAVTPAGPWVVRVLLVDGRGHAAAVLRSWRHRGR